MPKQSLFTCDRCGYEERTRPGLTLPDGWRVVAVKKKSAGLNSKFSTESKHMLCSECDHVLVAFMEDSNA